jgi:hypothetical protein
MAVPSDSYRQMGASPAIDKNCTPSYLSTDFARRRAELSPFRPDGPESAAFPPDLRDHAKPAASDASGPRRATRKEFSA